MAESTGAEGTESTGAGGTESTGTESTGAEGTTESQDWYEALPAQAKKMISALRTEAADKRVKLKATESQLNDQLRKVAEALGLTTGTEADPDKLIRELEEVKADARQRAIDLAVYQQAKKAGADPDAVLDSRMFQNSVVDLDPSGDSFLSDVLDRIKDAVTGNPKLRAEAEVKKPAGASGAANNGGPGKENKKANSLGEALAARIAAQRT